MVEIESATVRLGERDYTINEAPRLRAKTWREQFMAEMRPLLAQVGSVENIAIDHPEDLLRLLPVFETVFIAASDRIGEMLFAYSAELEADREYIEAHATDRQIIAAFGEVVKLADPFGVVGQIQRQIGRELVGTLSSLRSRNGASA